MKIIFFICCFIISSLHWKEQTKKARFIIFFEFGNIWQAVVFPAARWRWGLNFPRHCRDEKRTHWRLHYRDRFFSLPCRILSCTQQHAQKRVRGVAGSIFFFPKWVYVCTFQCAVCVCFLIWNSLSFFHFATKWNAIHRSCPFSSHFLIPMLLTMKEDALWRFSFLSFFFSILLNIISPLGGWLTSVGSSDKDPPLTASSLTCCKKSTPVHHSVQQIRHCYFSFFSSSSSFVHIMTSSTKSKVLIFVFRVLFNAGTPGGSTRQTHTQIYSRRVLFPAVRRRPVGGSSAVGADSNTLMDKRTSYAASQFSPARLTAMTLFSL